MLFRSASFGSSHLGPVAPTDDLIYAETALARHQQLQKDIDAVLQKEKQVSEAKELYLQGIDAASLENFEASLSFFRRAENIALSLENHPFAQEIMHLRVEIEMKSTASLALEADLKSRIMADEHMVRADKYVADKVQIGRAHV